jgi:hypothetical protein
MQASPQLFWVVNNWSGVSSVFVYVVKDSSSFVQCYHVYCVHVVVNILAAAGQVRLHGCATIKYRGSYFLFDMSWY